MFAENWPGPFGICNVTARHAGVIDNNGVASERQGQCSVCT